MRENGVKRIREEEMETYHEMFIARPEVRKLFFVAAGAEKEVIERAIEVMKEKKSA